VNSADHVHLLRLNEQASRDEPERYRRRVLRFALLGYGAVLLCALLGLAGLLTLAWHLQQGGRPGAWMAWLGLGCLGLLFAALQGLRVPFEAPQGEVLTAQDAPELFAALEKIRAKVGGPVLHKVWITPDFNAAIVQQPQWLGLRHRNHLMLGWPMLAALEPRRLFAVVAHEYGHLRGEHGKLSAWIYRTRLAWARLSRRYRESSSPVSWILGGFAGWYFPRFDALSFALAREDEYEADRVSARLFGPEVASQALLEIAIKAQWYEQEFWRRHWRLSRQQEHPAFHAELPVSLLRSNEPAWQQEALRREYRRLANFDDTHPVLKDRLAGLAPDGLRPGLPRPPEPSAGHTLGLLGSARERIAAALDAAWWQLHAADWRTHGERLRRLHEQALELQQRARAGTQPLVADEWLLWAEAVEALSEQDPTPLLERALSLAPRHPLVLRRLAARHAPKADLRVGEWLEQLYQNHEDQAWLAARLAQDWMDAAQAHDQVLPPEQRRLWRQRLSDSEAMEQSAWERFVELQPWERTLTPDLSGDQLRELRGVLLREGEVQAAWVGEQQLDVKPARRHFTFWVQAKPGWSDESADALAERLFQALRDSELPGRLRVMVLGRHVEPARRKVQGDLLSLVQRG